MIVYANTSNFIHIGRVGENLATQVIFDLSEYKKKWGVGEVQLLVERGLDYYPQICYKTGNKSYTYMSTNKMTKGHYYFEDAENIFSVITFYLPEDVPEGTVLTYNPTNQEKFFTITQIVNDKETLLPCKRIFIGDIDSYESTNVPRGSATNVRPGTLKLYQNLGENEDGSISQLVVTEEFKDKVEVEVLKDDKRPYEHTLFLYNDLDENDKSSSTSNSSDSTKTKNELSLDSNTILYITEYGLVLKENELEINEAFYYSYFKLPFVANNTPTDTLYAIWEITSADTQEEGVGKCALTYYVDNKIVKSANYSFIVTNSLGDDQEEAPEEYNWVELVLRKATYVETHMQLTKEYSEKAEAAATQAKSAELAAKEAQAASEEAQAAAEEARREAQDAQNAAEIAQVGAEDARKDAELAQERAEVAETGAIRAAIEAKEKAQEAKDSALAAEESKEKTQEAQSAAEEAQAIAEEAQREAVKAQNAADNSAKIAGTAQLIASTKADEVRENATTVAQKTEEAKSSADSANQAAATAVSAKNEAIEAKGKAEGARDIALAANLGLRINKLFQSKSEMEAFKPDYDGMIGGVVISGSSEETKTELYAYVDSAWKFMSTIDGNLGATIILRTWTAADFNS